MHHPTVTAHQPDAPETADSAPPSPPTGTVTTVVVGTPSARQRVADELVGLRAVPVDDWALLPAGAVVCIDADRFVALSPGGAALLAAAVLGGAPAAVPASNIDQWPLCGLRPPAGGATDDELAAHARAIAGRPSDVTIGGDTLLPAVFAVADSRRVTSRPNRIRDLGADALLVEAAWCHHRDTPFVSATMIVKNEAPRIQRAIAAARLLADEVVVYDTGSTDDTVELARAAGAAVRLGYWDDDFSRARNEAWAMMRGDWNFVVDADDTVDATPQQCAEVRDFLRHSSREIAVSVPLRSVQNEVSGVTTSGMYQRRIFPRHLHWCNRIHESVMRSDGRLPDEVRIDHLAIVHWGYASDMDGRAERNLRIASKRLAESDGSPAHALDLYEYGRALQLSDRIDEALDVFAEVIERFPEGPPFVMSALLTATLWCDSNRTVDIPALLGPIAHHHADDAARDAARWVMASSMGEPEVALEMLDGLEAVQFYNFVASPDEVRALHVFMAVLADEQNLALEQLARMERPSAQQSTWWAASVAVGADDARLARRLLAVVQEDELAYVVCALAGAPADGVHELAVGLIEKFGLQPPLAVYLATSGGRAGFFAALDARLRLAEVDLLHLGDPLESLLDGTYGDAGDQMLAALVLDRLEPVAPTRSLVVAPHVPDDLIESVLAAVAAVVPDQLTEAASALATTVERGALVAEVLDLLEA